MNPLFSIWDFRKKKKQMDQRQQQQYSNSDSQSFDHFLFGVFFFFVFLVHFIFEHFMKKKHYCKVSNSCEQHHFIKGFSLKGNNKIFFQRICNLQTIEKKFVIPYVYGSFFVVDSHSNSNDSIFIRSSFFLFEVGVENSRIMMMIKNK